MWPKKSASRVIAGRLAQSRGAGFENIFEAACHRQNIVCTRIPDGCKQLANRRLIRVKTPFDWVLSYKNASAVIDTKTTDGKTFPHSCVDPSQVNHLLKHEGKGTIAGYITWLREADTVLFIPAHMLAATLTKTGSIKIEDPGVVYLGSMTSVRIDKIFEPTP